MIAKSRKSQFWLLPNHLHPVTNKPSDRSIGQTNDSIEKLGKRLSTIPVILKNGMGMIINASI